MPSDKKSNGKRYSKAQKERILKFVFKHGNSEEVLKKEFGADAPNCSTVNRWINSTPHADLKQLAPKQYQDKKLKKQTERRINRGKKTEDSSALSMKSFYLCFKCAYSERGKDKQDGDQNKRSDCSNYKAFLEYLFEGCGAKVRFDQLQKQLSQRPYPQKVQNIFGPDKRLYDSICQQIRKVITINDKNEDIIKEDLRRQAVLASELKSCISSAIEYSEREQERIQADIEKLQAAIKEQEILQNVKEEQKQLQAAQEQQKQLLVGIEDLKYLHTSIKLYESPRQETFLISGAIGLLIFLIYGEGALFSDIRLKRDVVEMINRMCILNDYISDFLSVSLTTGIGGRMGRHQLLQLAAQPNDINPFAAYELGEYYYNNKEYDRAFEYYDKSASRGHAVGAWSCGFMLVNNRGSNTCGKYSTREAQFKEAYNYFKIGECMGAPAAIHAIGQLYMRGQIVNDRMEFEKPDYEKAIAYFEIAIGKNYFYSHNALAWVYEKMAKASENEIEKKELYEKAYHQYEMASVYSDGYSRNKMGIFWETGLIHKPCKEKAACFYLHALNVLEADIEPWSYYNAGRVFCKMVTTVHELNDEELGIHETLPNDEKAKTYLKKACAFMERQCEARHPRAYTTADDPFLNKYLDCVLQLTKLNITKLDENYYDLLSSVQKALNAAKRWFSLFPSPNPSMGISRDIHGAIKQKEKWILKNAHQIEEIAGEMRNSTQEEKSL